MLKDFLLANLTANRVIVALLFVYSLALILFPTPVVLLAAIVLVLFVALIGQFTAKPTVG